MKLFIFRCFIGGFFLLLSSCAQYQLHSPPKSIKTSRPALSGLSTTFADEIPFSDADSSAHIEEGMASWYGPGFYGRRTASGARFTKHKLTCAHRTLPLGTRIEVTNLKNGQSVELLVNDRGPAISSRILDVSYAAAKQLGFLRSGLVAVRLKVLEEKEVFHNESLWLKEPG